MRELGRLLRYSRPYAGFLFLAVVLMAMVGAAQGLTVRLIGPIFENRVHEWEGHFGLLPSGHPSR